MKWLYLNKKDPHSIIGKCYFRFFIDCISKKIRRVFLKTKEKDKKSNFNIFKNSYISYIRETDRGYFLKL